MTPLSVDEIAFGLQRQYGLDAETAQRRARAAVGELVAPQPSPQALAEADRRSDLDEKREQLAIRKMAVGIGFKIYNLSQSRAAKQTPGLCDLWIAHRDRGFCAWWESKRQVGGERSSAQREFAELCALARVPYGFGDRYAFARFLQEHDFAPPPFPRD